MDKQKTDTGELIKEALLKLRRMRAKLDEYKNERHEPIAVIGMACRFPGAESPDAFWNLLKEGRTCISKVPQERWDVEAFLDSDPKAPGKIYSPYGGFIGNLDGFDAPFFDISAREAACMDPQQRLVMEVAWETLENANINPQSVYGSNCGVFLGIGNWENAVIRFGIGNPEAIGSYEGTGSSNCVAAGRVAYFLGLTGPNMAVDTACSSSLLSAHLACESLRRKECDMALSGGSHLLLLPGMSICFCRAGMLSRDGLSKAFDASADGYVRGEGVGMVALKRVSDARRDGDRIIALIRGSAVNQDGSSGGLTVPSGPSQEKVIQKALENARLTPDEVGVIEAHGTGTPLGDPIELRALGNVFCKKTRPAPLVVGSVKTNIGHLESSAGISALIKTALMLKFGEIPPHPHFKTPSPHIDWDNLDVEIPVEHKVWQKNEGGERIAGISSFGFSGTNVHAVLSEYTENGYEENRTEKNAEESTSLQKGPYLLVLSARHPEALKDMARQYASLLTEHPDIHPADICYTAMTCRARFTHRLAVTGGTGPELVNGLNAFTDGESRTGLFTSTDHEGPPGQAHPLTVPPKDETQRLDLYHTLAADFVSGVPVEWAPLFKDLKMKRVPLPTYPFQHKSYPVNPFGAVTGGSPAPAPDVHPLLGEPVNNAMGERFFNTLITRDFPAYLQGHRIHGNPVLPGAAYAEMALKAGALQMNGKTPILEEMRFLAPMLTDTPRRVQLFLTPSGESGFDVNIYSSNKTADEDWILHATGRISQAVPQKKEKENTRFAPPEETATSFSREMNASDYYDQLSLDGFEYGGEFVSLSRIYLNPEEAMGLVDVKTNARENPSPGLYVLHPLFLDGCFQLVNCLTPKTKNNALFLPVGFDRLVLFKPPVHRFWVHARTMTSGERHFKADLTLLSESGELICEIKGLTGRSVPRRELISRFQAPALETIHDVRWLPAPRKNMETPDTQEPPSGYLIFCPKGSRPGAELARELKLHGYKTTLVTPGRTFNQTDDRSFSINPATPEHYQRLFETIAKEPVPTENIIHMWFPDGSFPSEDPIDTETGWQILLHLARSTGVLKRKTLPRLWVVTGGMVNVNGEAMEMPPFDAALWGLAQVITLEYPELRTVCIDLDLLDPAPAGTLLQELRFSDAEDRIALRQGKRYGARILPHQAFPEPEDAPVKLRLHSYEGLESLETAPLERRPPHPDEVEIRVHSAGLNFRDVLNALGMLKDINTEMGMENAAELPLGFECSGTIAALGAHVTHLDIGTPVIAAMAKGSLASFVTAPAAHVIQKPENISFRAASTVSTAFLTAFHGLFNLAGIQRGERVLIHAAAGGVGMAAVQLAKQAGAIIFATASRSKWDILKARGVTRIMDSRTLTFADEILEHTDGKGVDVILNSLTGDFIRRSFKVLAKGGRFVEIGKIGVWTPEEAAEKRPDAAYHLFDMNDVAIESPEAITRMLDEMARRITTGEFLPLPFQNYGFHEAKDAFRSMAKAEHIGKVVITVNPSHGSGIQSDATYLITGGTGALGLSMAASLVAEGATHLLLLGRSKPLPASMDMIKTMEQKGADIRVMAGDVADDARMEEIWTHMHSKMPPLKGIIHAAGVIDDGMLADLDATRFRTVLHPKVKGTWNLHRLSLGDNPDFFVMFSSLASLLGNVGQGNYAAANGFMDAMAHYRRSRGLPATAINWGAWEKGMAGSQIRPMAQGATPIDVKTGKALFHMILNENPIQTGAFAMDWSLFCRNIIGPVPAVLSNILQTDENPADAGGTSEMTATLNDCEPKERYRLLMDITTQLAVDVLGHDLESLITDHPLMEQGFDSLMAVELRNRLGRELGKALPASLLFDYPTLEKLAAYLLEEVIEFEPAVPTVPSEKTEGRESALSADGILEELDALLN